MSLVKVRYKGLSDVRVMSKADLAAAGVGVSGQLKWDRTNRWVQYVENPSDALLEVLAAEGTFTVEEVDAETKKTVKHFVQGQELDDTGATVVDGTTGQKSTRKG